MSALELTGSPAPHRRPTEAPHRRPTEAPRHLRLVTDDEIRHLRRRRHVRVGGAALVGLVITLLFAAVTMHAKLAQNQLRLDNVTKQGDDAQAQYQRLQLQVDQLSSPQRILSIAQGRLGMVVPHSVNFASPARATKPASGSAAGQAVASPPADPGGPPPAQAPSGWSTVKPQLAASS